MDERVIIALISAVGFVIIALTPIVPLMLHTYDVDNIYITKAIIGILSLICGYGVVFGLFKKKDQIKQPKEGKLRIKPILLLVGIGIICLSWFTDIPMWCADWSGLSNTFTYNGDLLNGGIGTRIWVSIFTALGVLLIKLSIKRDDERLLGMEEEKRYSRYNDMIDNSNKNGGVAWTP